MKKIAAIIIGISLLVGNTIIFHAEEKESISGFKECMDKIFLKSEMYDEVKGRMQETYTDIFNSMVNSMMKNPDYVKEKMGIELGDDDYELEQIQNMFSLDLDKGLLISPITTFKYSVQYVKNGYYSYLFDDKDQVFCVCGKVLDGGNFSIDGNYLPESTGVVAIAPQAWEFITNYEMLENDLLEIGEKSVYDIKLFQVGYLKLLYIKGEVNEYLVKLTYPDTVILPEIESFVLFKADEIMDAFNDPEVQADVYSKGLAKQAVMVKPTFETEALSLQEDGLLQGNENGLDLLKPLTRIEAATMLLRAIGESTDYTTQTQTFSDVPVSHWGYGAAENAYSLGLVMGIGDGLFAPDDGVTAEQFATMVLRAANHSPFNWEEAVNIMISEGVITSENAETMDLFTRGDMAKIIYEARERNLI